MSRRLILHSVCGFEGLRDGAPLTMSDRLRLTRAAGFDGVSAHLFDPGPVAGWIGEARKLGLAAETARTAGKRR